MKKEDLEKNVEGYLSRREPHRRLTSFDYCYNYFYKNKHLSEDIERSCLVLGFYLVSWGMYRGNSFLLQRSVKHFKPLMQYISGLPENRWDIDVDSYNDENKKIIIEIYDIIKEKIMKDYDRNEREEHADLTLVTKIMLGIFGFIPAFDRFFCDTFKDISDKKRGVIAVNKESLGVIRKFYNDNMTIIDDFHRKTFTLDFTTGEETKIHYPKAKIIDMYGFNIGYEKVEKEKEEKNKIKISYMKKLADYSGETEPPVAHQTEQLAKKNLDNGVTRGKKSELIREILKEGGDVSISDVCKKVIERGGGKFKQCYYSEVERIIRKQRQ
jgi:hypothetical protein